MNRIPTLRGIGALLLALALTARWGGGAEAFAEEPLAEQIDGVLSLTPVGAASFIAVEVTPGPTSRIAGLRWFHNDGSSVFPRVLIAGATDVGEPDLGEVRAEATAVAGASLAWAEVSFTEPPAATAGKLFAVFQLPPFEERSAEGLGGGSGIGFRATRGGPAAYLSDDGVEWVRLASSTAMAVEARLVAAVGGTLSKGAAVQPDGLLASGTVFETALGPVEPSGVPGSVRVRFSLAQAGHTSVEIYNVRGQRVRAVLGEPATAGEHVLEWNGADDRGAPVASGTYIVRMEALGRSFHRKLTIVR